MHQSDESHITWRQQRRSRPPPRIGRLASMQARPGRFSPLVHAFQASFMGSRRRMSGTQMVADITFVLSVPQWHEAGVAVRLL